jgi:hypothetical protein
MVDEVVGALQGALQGCKVVPVAPKRGSLPARSWLQDSLQQRRGGCKIWLWPAALVVAFSLNISAAWAQTCAGDCNADGEVTVDEVITLVDIALDTAPLSACPAGNLNGDGAITVDEVLSAVNADLNGCSNAPQTRLKGQITLPLSNQCTDCSVKLVDFGVIGLVQNAPPQVIGSGTTDSQGGFDTGDLSAALSNPANGSVDTNGDGKRTVIVVATVNSNGANIGGVDSIPTGAVSTKNFNTTTQVACVAAVFLTSGTTDPCVVKATCTADEPACLPTVDPDALDATRIGRLEQAASLISASVVLPDDVAQAACAAITCTQGGTMEASAQCVTAYFPAVP